MGEEKYCHHYESQINYIKTQQLFLLLTEGKLLRFNVQDLQQFQIVI